MSTNPFIRPVKGYVRDLDLLGNARADSAHYLHIRSGRPFDQCLEFVNKATGPGGQFELTNRNVRITKRKSNGDRVKGAIGFTELIQKVSTTESIFSPNMVVYDNPRVRLSYLSKFIEDNMAKRSVIKKRGQQAKMEKNYNLATYCDNLQTVIKTLNNSLSGAHASPHNPMYIKTAHSALTSATRIATSYGNASTERLLSGNRHYWSADVALHNIISITRNTDYDLLQKVMHKYQLKVPTDADIRELLNRSTLMYWDSPKGLDEILEIVGKLNDLQKAAFVYTGDLYHVMKHNDSFMRGFITELITRPDYIVENPDEVVKNCNSDIVALCGILCSDFLAGKQVSKLKETDYPNYLVYASVVDHINKVFDDYADFIKVFLVTDNMPPSIFYFRSSIRRVVVGSDTDSTMFTCQDWVEWYCGNLDMTLKGQSISATMMYFNTQVIAHMLALVSRQLGVEDKKLFYLQMKNEYSFLVYMVANRAKHYVTMINAKEGNIFAKPEIDIKGVGLKDSKLPKKIMGTLEKVFINTTQEIMDGNKIKIYDIMQRIANIEHEIYASLNNCSIEYLSKARINSKAAYKKPNSSNWVHYPMWNDVFAEKYGQADAPPYACVKISNKLNTGKKFTDWINSLEPTISNNLTGWAKQYEKGHITQFLLPIDRMQNGFPKEILPCIDTRRIVTELMGGFYILLEIIGFYYRNKHNSRLLSDELIYRPEFGTFLVE